MSDALRQCRTVFDVWVEELHQGTPAYDQHPGNVDPTVALV